MKKVNKEFVVIMLIVVVLYLMWSNAVEDNTFFWIAILGILFSLLKGYFFEKEN